ncbi:uncharacterized protein SRS1_11659 [Sporisorium reilianum f. sp. reilianum]|uniref:Uncharacterized protein n=1 Tax=Sporisorium reilianum f. sp. reilianum TaxID=72559 RepID=A0A2N8U5L4_9BASI|nr:uncharacterized protein SRS1_11659 [Sporisorium reilianum f. sp. reilianum]
MSTLPTSAQSETPRADTTRQTSPTQPALDPSSQIAKDLHTLAERLKTQPTEDLARRWALKTGLAMLQAQSYTTQAKFILTHPVETRMGTCTVGNALIHTGIIWTLCCRSDWVAKVSSEWMRLSNAPVRLLVCAGATAFYLNPPAPKWDARFAAHKAGRFVKSLNDTIKS